MDPVYSFAVGLVTYFIICPLVVKLYTLYTERKR